MPDITAEQIITDKLRDLDEYGPDYQASEVAAALRAAGLLPGPDTIRERLNAEADRYGLPHDDLDGLLRHIYGNRDLARAADAMTIALLRTKVPGPDTITVNREDLIHLWTIAAGMVGVDLDRCPRCQSLCANVELQVALSEPPAPKEQQP